jgi:hypothetical protein
MTIPTGYTFATWYNQIGSNLNASNSEIAVFQKYWSSFTAAQKTSIKNLAKATIDEAITNLTALKTDIDAL